MLKCKKQNNPNPPPPPPKKNKKNKKKNRTEQNIKYYPQVSVVFFIFFTRCETYCTGKPGQFHTVYLVTSNAGMFYYRGYKQ